MSANRRHHFVPQFYLKRFSGGRPFIACFNKTQGQQIDAAPIKGQCQIPRYYDWNPDVERTLSILESSASALMRQIDELRDLASLESEDWALLITFVALQSARTKVTGDSNDKFTDYYAKLVAKGHPDLKGVNLDNFEIKNTFPTALPIEIMLKAADTFASLSPSLLENRTNFPFLGSDNPVIRYNSQGREIKYQGTIGLDCPGLQIIYPISPSLAIYLFDSNVYRNPSNTGIRKLSSLDALKISFLQYLWSDENVYYDPSVIMPHIPLIHAALGPYDRWDRIRIVESEPNVAPDGSSGSLVIHYQPQAPIEIVFDFAKVKVPYDPDLVGRSLARKRNKPNKGGSWTSYAVAPEKPRSHFGPHEIGLLSKSILKQMR